MIKYLANRSGRLFHMFETDATRLFWLFVGVQLVAWTLIPALVFANLPLDTIEMLAWGHEWQLGYAKHPPLPAWILEALAWISGRAEWTAYFASPLAIVIAYWAIWRLGRELIGEQAALISVFLTSLIFYYNYPTIEFNHNIAQIPVWALLGLFGWLALRDDRLRDWLMLGLFAGLSIYIKYSQGIMIIILISFALAHRETRPRLAGKGFWLALLTALLIALPHLYWMYATEFQSLFYAAGRARPLHGIVATVTGPLKFLLAQIANHGGLILVLILGGAVLPMDRRRGREPVFFATTDPLARRYLMWIALGPVLFTVILSLLLGIKFRSMWGAPMFSFSALALMVVMKPVFFKERFGFMAATWAVLYIGVLLAIIGAGMMRLIFADKPSRTSYPGKEIANHFSKLWSEHSTRPFSNVVGERWIGGNIAYYAPARPSLLIESERNKAPWTTAESFACDGALIVWQGGGEQIARMPARYQTGLGQPKASGEAQFVWKQGAKPIRIGWAIVSGTKNCGVKN